MPETKPKPVYAYKVVSKDTRHGTNAIFFGVEAIPRLLMSYPGLTPYFPKYTKGSIVVAPIKSMGICCFQTRKMANLFIKEELMNKDKTEIIRVQCYGNSKKREKIKLISGCGSYPTQLLKGRPSKRDYRDIPTGFCSYPYVKVLS
jgi:hypothetical protein